MEQKSEEKFACIYRTPSYDQLAIIKSLLDANKITYFIENEQFASLAGVSDGAVSFGIMIKASYLEIFIQIIRNKIFMTTLAAWIIAQTLKVTIGVIRERKFDFRWFVGTGGMPYSHAAGASCLATSIGFEHGFNSVHFALAASFAIVVMFDAQGVRRATGKQARILNKLMDRSKLWTVPNFILEFFQKQSYNKVEFSLRDKNISKELGIKTSDLVVRMISCFKPQKALKDFIKLAYLVNQTLPDTKFFLVDDGILRKKKKT